MRALLGAAASLAAALALAAPAAAGGDSALSWSVTARDGVPVVTWEITGETQWYVAEIQIASRPDADAGGFPPEHLVAYAVLTPARSDGTWRGPSALPPGTYHALLELRHPGGCGPPCTTTTSTRSFAVDPPTDAALAWSAAADRGRVAVRWKAPPKGWYVALVLVDDDRNFATPADARLWAGPRKATGWTSRRLRPGTFWARVHLRYEGCTTCFWTSEPRRVLLRLRNDTPRLRSASFSLARRDEAGGRHWWRASIRACDDSAGRLTLRIREERMGPAGAARTHVRTLALAPPGGCRSYTVNGRFRFAWQPGASARIGLRLEDAEGGTSRWRSRAWRA